MELIYYHERYTDVDLVLEGEVQGNVLLRKSVINAWGSTKGIGKSEREVHIGLTKLNNVEIS